MNRILIGLLAAFLLAGAVPADRALADISRRKINKGIKAFQKQQWDDALKYFRDAQVDDPENPLAHYNLGEALYKKQKYEEAEKEYQKALGSEDVRLKEQAYYNLGNTYYQMNKYQEAIRSYIKALELNPADRDAKHNLELVRAKLKEMAKKQPQQNRQQQQQNRQDQQQQQKQQGEKGSDKQQQQQQRAEQKKENQEQKQQQMAQQNKDQQQKGKQQKQSAQKVKKKPLSKEEAERILQALRSKEKENQKLRRVKQPAGKGRPEKDW